MWTENATIAWLVWHTAIAGTLDRMALSVIGGAEAFLLGFRRHCLRGPPKCASAVLRIGNWAAKVASTVLRRGDWAAELAVRSFAERRLGGGVGRAQFCS